MGQAQESDTSSIDHFSGPVGALQSLIDFFDHQGVIIGGVAASLLGTPRFTADIDAVLLLGFDDLPALLREAEKHSIEPRIPDAIEFAHRSRVVLLRHTPSETDIDLSLGILPFEIEMVQRSRLVAVGEINIRIPMPEDLIILKAVAHRPKDLADIQAIAAANPGLDKKRIRHWLEQFGEALETPNLWEEISRLI